MCELREVAKGRTGFGKEGTGLGSKPRRNTKENRQSLKKKMRQRTSGYASLCIKCLLRP